MEISSKDVEDAAALARLRFSAQEVDTFTRQLNSILTYFETLQNVDTENVEPATHAVQVANVFREDTVKASLGADASLRNAPDSAQSCFKVPKIIEV